LTYAVLYRFFGPGRGDIICTSYCPTPCLRACFLILSALVAGLPHSPLQLTALRVHPANTEAVSWISGITDTTCALFFLLSLLVYLQDRSHPQISGCSALIPFLAGML
jgi:hypothetical protein